ncbi:MAG: DUF5719 family protein [Aeromicrobium erythreum]
MSRPTRPEGAEAPGARSTGRRVAARAPRRRVPVALAVVLPVVAALVVGLAQLVGPARTAATPPRQVPLDRAAYACPADEGLTVAAGQVRAGRSASVTTPGGDPPTGLDAPGRWRTAPGAGGVVTIDQAGAGSGPVGFTAGRAPRSAGRGLVVGSCPDASGDAWFTDTGSGGEHTTTLVLTNLGDTPGVADVRLWGPAGPVDAVDAKGLLVEPRSTRRVRLADLAAGEPLLAVHVERVRGALAVSALDGSTADSAGTELQRSTLAPRRQQVLAPLPVGETGRRLTLVNPGDQVARVRVRALGQDGAFTPEGLTALRVPGGRVVAVDLPQAVGSGRVALELSASEPVAASVRVAPTGEDFGTATATTPLTGPAVVPVALDESRRPELVLGATSGRAVRVGLTAYDASMRRVDAATVRVAGTSTLGVDLARTLDLGDAAYVVVRPASAGVVGTASYTDGDRLALLPLRPAPVTAAGPQVRPAP